jgi:STIP1 family protein 1
MANLKLTRWDEVITDSLQAIELSPVNMKGYYYLAQAEIELERPREALESAKKAHEYCVQEIQKGGKAGGSIGPITQLVLRAKKEDWERREKERIRSRKGLLVELLEDLERKRDQQLKEAKEAGEVESREIRVEWETKIETLKRAFEDASRIGGVEGNESRRRKVPDWVVDDITFSVMVDPVVVSYTLSLHDLTFFLSPYCPSCI